VFDVATSVVAGRKVIAAAEAENTIPLGWLLDASGNPSTDPRDFTRGGALVPFGGHKGYGLALAFEVFAGVLTGAGIGSGIQGRKHDSAGGVGHVFRAINVAAFMPLEAFHARMDLLIDQMKAAGKAPGVSDILIPGERAHRNEMASNTLGVPLAKQTLQALTRLASTLGIDPPQTEMP
jgi:LDH2 family malate/lactate/ureidoglycolate dehydrogenase